MFTNILTMGQVLPWIPSQSCMHMGTCAKCRIGARAHKAILYKTVDMLGKTKQAIHDVPRALYLPYCLCLRLNDHALVHIELRGAIVELAPKSNMASGVWSCDHYVKLLMFMLTNTQS